MCVGSWMLWLAAGGVWCLAFLFHWLSTVIRHVKFQSVLIHEPLAASNTLCFTAYENNNDNYNKIIIIIIINDNNTKLNSIVYFTASFNLKFHTTSSIIHRQCCVLTHASTSIIHGLLCARTFCSNNVPTNFRFFIIRHSMHDTYVRCQLKLVQVKWKAAFTNTLTKATHEHQKYIKQALVVVVWRSGNALVSINEVNRRK